MQRLVLQLPHHLALSTCSHEDMQRHCMVAATETCSTITSAATRAGRGILSCTETLGAQNNTFLWLQPAATTTYSTVNLQPIEHAKACHPASMIAYNTINSQLQEGQKRQGKHKHPIAYQPAATRSYRDHLQPHKHARTDHPASMRAYAAVQYAALSGCCLYCKLRQHSKLCLLGVMMSNSPAGRLC